MKTQEEEMQDICVVYDCNFSQLVEGHDVECSEYPWGSAAFISTDSIYDDLQKKKMRRLAQDELCEIAIKELVKFQHEVFSLRSSGHTFRSALQIHKHYRDYDSSKRKRCVWRRQKRE